MAQNSDKRDILSNYGTLNDMTPAPKPGKSPGRTTFTNTLYDQTRSSYTNDTISGKKEFLAVVLRDENYYNRDIAPANSPQAIAPHLFANDTTKMVKVRASIPEIHASLPRPKHSEQHAIIEMYPVFVCSREVLGGRQPAVGEVIRVTFGDLHTMSQPTIVGLASNGNKQPGSSLFNQQCKDPIRKTMTAKAAAGAGLPTPDLSKATTTTPNMSGKVDGNYARAVRVSQKVKEESSDNAEIPVEVLLAFMSIESKGKADAIRFEPHIFVGKGASWMKLNGKRGRPEKKGTMPTGVPYTKPNKGPSYSKVYSETNKKAFENALRVDPMWAVYSTSFGTYQVMGFNILTDSNTKFLGLSAEDFYNKFKANPEEVSDDTIIRWIVKKNAWRTIAKKATPLSDEDLRKLIKYYNGSGQIEAYFSRIGGGLKKAYEKAIETVAAQGRIASVQPQSSPPPNPPVTEPATTQAPPGQQLNVEDAQQRAQEAGIGEHCTEEIVSRLNPKPPRQNKHEKKKIKCNESGRLGDSKPKDKKKLKPSEIKTSTWDRYTNRRVQKLHPKIRQMVINFINDAQDRGYKLRVASGLRTFKEQEVLYAKGRPNGRKVSNARPGTSFHNYGLAVDVVEIGPTKGMDGYKKGYDKTRWDEIGKIGKEHGFFWGGDFKSLSDKPHFEFNDGKKIKIRGPQGLLEKHRANKKDKDGYVII